ncbi:MAG TPA: hypothetical protein PKX94_08475, partial [Opitutales bacterium]|nr:hypothetical protein [Opitutales bacterium]
MSEEQHQWFSLDTERNKCVVSFKEHPDRKWQADVICRFPLPQSDLEGQTVWMEGKAPQWMYIHTSVWAVRSGASEIHVFQPDTGYTKVYPITGESMETTQSLVSIKDIPAAGSIVEFQANTNIRLTPEILPSLKKMLESRLNPHLVTITGRGPNWGYAATGAIAATEPERNIAYYSPKESFSFLLTARDPQNVMIPALPDRLQIQEEPGTIIGIIGDPNSGKSVFSKLLEPYFSKYHPGKSWRMDCDHAAPTSDWYIQMIRQGKHHEASQIRNSQKKPWTKDAEKTLAENQINAKRTFKWILADYPGGIHRPSESIRIPQGREIMLKQANAFVIVARNDRPQSISGWMEALNKHNLDERIIGIVHSSKPDDPVSLDWDITNSRIEAQITGLHRSHTSQDIIDPGKQWE